jgi:hypothetical protein
VCFFLIRRIPYSHEKVGTIRNEKLEVSDWTAGPEGGTGFGEMSSGEEELL